MSDFVLSEKVDKNKIFLIKKSVLLDRWDPVMNRYNNRFTNFNFNVVHLRDLLLTNPQYGTAESGSQRTNVNEPRYIRITDIDDNGDLIGELGATANNVEPQYVLRENDILIARSGATVGKSYIHISKGYVCFFAGYLIRFIVNKDLLLPRYLFVYTHLSTYKEWVRVIQRASAQPNINAEEYKSMLIPLPSLDKQKGIVELYDSAYSLRAQKLHQAKELLDSIDSYLLNELGITIPKTHYDGIKDRMFLVKHSDVVGKRMDPKYSIKFKSLFSNTKYHFVSLKDVLLENTNGQYGANEEAIDWDKNKTRYIRITDIDELGNLKNNDKKSANYIDQKYLLQYNDFLFARSGSVGKSYIHKNISEPAIFAGYLIRFTLNNDIIDSDYLFYYCNSKLYWMWVEAIQRPAVQANINSEEFKSLLISLPPLDKQKEIANTISSMRQQAKTLELEGDKILEDAKKEIEKMILG